MQTPSYPFLKISTLDRLAIALAVMSLGFLAFVIRAPFFHAAIVGAALLGIRAHLTGKREPPRDRRLPAAVDHRQRYRQWAGD